MRVRFDNNTIKECKVAKLEEDSELLVVRTFHHDERITIDCRTPGKALNAYNQLLTEGYFDARFLETFLK